jgi:hypothetical protein
MNTKKVVLAGALAAVAILALGTIGFAAAQTRSGPDGSSMHGTMGNHDQMSGHAGMNCDAMDEMSAAGTGHHAQMHEAVAKALGITVAELDAQLASGNTVADIAKEKGIDLDTLHAAMQEAHPAGHGAGMNHAGMMSNHD